MLQRPCDRGTRSQPLSETRRKATDRYRDSSQRDVRLSVINPTMATIAAHSCAMRRFVVDAELSRINKTETATSIRQTAVFAFIVTKAGWTLFNVSTSNIQPSNAAKPIENVSSTKTRDKDLHSASCRSGYGERVSDVVRDVTAVYYSGSLSFRGLRKSLYCLVLSV